MCVCVCVYEQSRQNFLKSSLVHPFERELPEAFSGTRAVPVCCNMVAPLWKQVRCLGRKKAVQTLHLLWANASNAWNSLSVEAWGCWQVKRLRFHSYLNWGIEKSCRIAESSASHLHKQTNPHKRKFSLLECSALLPSAHSLPLMVEWRSPFTNLSHLQGLHLFCP